MLRGVSGCGKSTYAEWLKSLHHPDDCVICCADDYFTDKNGNYKFNPEGIASAHDACQRKFRQAIYDRKKLVIVCNTSTRIRDVQYYKRIADQHEYQTTVLTVENWNNTVNIHNVPEETLERQEKQLRESIKLRSTTPSLKDGGFLPPKL